MTPQELHSAVDTRRREHGLKWWQVALTLDVSPTTLQAMGRGAVSEAVRTKVETWLAETEGGQ